MYYNCDIPISRIYNNYDKDLEVIEFIDKNYNDAKYFQFPVIIITKGSRTYKFNRVYSGLDPVRIT